MNNYRLHSINILIKLALMSIVLTGCGYRGELYLPDHNNPPIATTTAAAATTTPPPSSFADAQADLTTVSIL